MGLAIDGVIILGYFAIILFVGLYMGRREHSLRDFALGGRKIPWWAVMASIIAAETSAATYLGVPGEGYAMHSLAYAQIALGVILGRVLVGWFFLKPYYAYRVYTVYDYLGVRFGAMSKNYVSLLFLFMRTLASGTRLFVPSLVMVLAFRLFFTSGTQGANSPVNNVWVYVIAVAVLTIITCIYTALGGIKAVIWTDLIQASLMFGTAVIAIIVLLHEIGSGSLSQGFHALEQLVPHMKQHEGYFILGWEPDLVSKWLTMHHLSHMNAWEWIKLTLASPYTIFSALIANTVANVAAFGTDQDMVQRLLTASTYRKSRRSLISAALMDVPIYLVFAFIGVLLLGYYTQHPQLTPASSADVFAWYIFNRMPIGLRGLVLAGIFATAMGSTSSALNALATSATNDWYIPYFSRRAGERHHVNAARMFTVLFAILMIVIAGFFALAKVTNPNVRIIPVVLGIANFILGPMLGVFLIGMLTQRRGSDRGNMIAITCGILATIYLGNLHDDLLKLLGLGRYHYPPPIQVSFLWFALVGAVVVFIVGICFKTPGSVLENALRIQAEAGTDDRPMALRIPAASSEPSSETERSPRVP
jgi:SSS family transporter